MRRRHRPSTRIAATAAALAAVGGVVAGADGAVRSSTYSITEIKQSSSVRAGNGTVTYASNASFRFRSRIGRVRVRFDFPARRGNADPVVSGGTNPRFGVLQGVNAQVATQRGTVTHAGRVCNFRPVVPRDERELTVDFRRTGKGNPRFVYPVVRGPNALFRLHEEIPFFDRNVCNVRSDLVPVSPARSKGFEEWESIRVSRKKLRREFRGRRTKVVLRGTTRTPLQIVPTRTGSVVVTTTITMRLVGSR